MSMNVRGWRLIGLILALWAFAVACGLALTSCSKRENAPPDVGVVNAIQVVQIGREAFADDVFTFDSYYEKLDPIWVAENLRPSDLWNELGGGFRDNIGDCDDFSRAAVSVAVRKFRKAGKDYSPAYGQVVVFDDLGAKHAQNWFIGPANVIYFHEPQTGKVWMPPTVELHSTIWRVL